ncbi:MAG TPA: hypothetical protein VJ464_07225 [Blastocatellia bacterium]|nr:hypothetical protein [Blastocatellia bacterium]
MKIAFRLFAATCLAFISLSGWSCTSTPTDAADNKNQPPAPPAAKAKTAATGTLTANPNPIKVCDKTGAGVTTISWAANGASAIEVHIGKPDGDTFVAKADPVGHWTTSKWVGNGMTFYLQDVSGGKPLAAENTIATLTVNVTAEGCP